MPVWVTILVSIVTVFILIAGALNFPYVPMWFGLYGADRQSARGKLVYQLIWAFPLVAVVSLYLGWAQNGSFALLPMVYIVIVWALRPNRGYSKGPGKDYSSASQNLDAKLAEVDFRWSQWASQKAQKQYLFITLFASSGEAADRLKARLTESENLHSDIEIQSYDNDTASLYVSIMLDTMEKDRVITILKRMVNTAWQIDCEVSAIDIMEDE